MATVRHTLFDHRIEGFKQGHARFFHLFEIIDKYSDILKAVTRFSQGF